LRKKSVFWGDDGVDPCFWRKRPQGKKPVPELKGGVAHKGPSGKWGNRGGNEKRNRGAKESPKRRCIG